MENEKQSSSSEVILSRTPPLHLALVSDIACWFFGVLPAILAWTFPVMLLMHFVGSGFFWPFLTLLPVLASLALIVLVFLFRQLYPSLKPGLYSMGISREIMSWYFQLSLNRAVRIALLWPIINSSHVLKFLYFRAIGAKVAFGINTSLNLTLVDAPLITVEKGATLSEGVYISCHTFVGDRLMLRPVVIGRNSFIGMNCLIGPATKVGSDSWIGTGNVLFLDKLPEKTKLANFEWMGGNPKRRKTT